MSQVDLLYRLQQIDDEIAQKKQRFSEVLRLQKESKELLEIRERSKTAAAELQKWRVRQKDLNLELQGLTDKAKRSENRLYSGLVKNPKELSDLQHEIEGLNRRRAGLEDELLDVMIMMEETEAANDEASAALERIEAAWAASQEHLKTEQNELVHRINDLNRIRKEHTGSIPPNFIAAYDKTMKSSKGMAVVLLSNNRCRGCLVTVPSTLIKAADEGKLVYCDNCGRILSPA